MALEGTTCNERTSGEVAPVADRFSAAAGGRFAVVTTHVIDEVEAVWRQLETVGIESPGQSFDFLKCWIESFSIPREDQLFVLVYDGDRPVLVLALHLQRLWGMRVLATFPGDHVGTNAPLMDQAYIAALSAGERAGLWHAVQEALDGAELAYLCCFPTALAGVEGFFDGFGVPVPADELHRSVFTSWEQCDAEQRTRSRRKHDKQQGAKLDAMGDVTFETLDSGADIAEIMAVMFRQRNDRFRQQGIADPFDYEDVRRFYRQVFTAGGDLGGRLHVLRLNGDVVAVRYNLMHKDRMFCLISSMSTAPEIQPGSPGKQCLLRVMQTEFDNGYSMFDMGSGLTDEKRHWCNVHIPLAHHYVQLTLRGRIFTFVHRHYQLLKVFLKSNQRMFATIRAWRARLLGRRG